MAALDDQLLFSLAGEQFFPTSFQIAELLFIKILFSSSSANLFNEIVKFLVILTLIFESSNKDQIETRRIKSQQMSQRHWPVMTR